MIKNVDNDINNSDDGGDIRLTGVRFKLSSYE